jgi:predicted transglutaminase-like cysteine proteinase
MFGLVAARCVAGLFVGLLAVCNGPGSVSAQEMASAQDTAKDPAFAQAQINLAAIDPAEPTTQSSTRGSAAVEPFGLDTVPVASGELLTKWSGITADINAERDILARCRDGATVCPAAAQKFLAVVAEGRAQTGRARIGVINRAINLAIRPTSDVAQWGVADRWSAPLATLASGRGDCEDYAIAKYVALIEAGVAADDVRLVIVRDTAIGEDHAVVTARLDGSWIVLDNRRLALLEDVEMRRIVPLFVLDRDGIKQFTPATVADAQGATPTAAPGALGF